MTAQWQDEYLSMVQDCQQRFGLLNEWEQSFVESLRRQMDRPRFVIRPRQITTLEGIWDRVTRQQPAAVVYRG